MPQKPTNLLDIMSVDDRAKVIARETEIEDRKSNYTTKEWLSLSEFGYYFGWQAVKDIMNDVMSLSQMNRLITGARIIHANHVYDTAIAVCAGTRGNTDTDKAFDNLMQPYTDLMQEII